MKQLSKTLCRRLLPTLMLLLTVAIPALAQGSIEVRGTVVDGTGEPLIGASVVVKRNAAQGTTTDFDGHFVLKVPSEQTTLVISYVGMNTKEVKVGRQRTFSVTLTDNTQLSEVIVVGYGQQKKASVVHRRGTTRPRWCSSMVSSARCRVSICRVWPRSPC